jgi:hypothetical protein
MKPGAKNKPMSTRATVRTVAKSPTDEPKDPFGAVRIAASQHCRKDRMPVGTVVIRQRQKGKRVRYARFIKVKNGGLPQQRWKLFARWWWEKNRGPVPLGQLVIHLDGDELNDKPSNLAVGTPGMKLVLRHKRDPEWSKAQHRRAAAGCGEFNRRNGRTNRAKNLLKGYWYPVVDAMSVILNVPFRRRKRLWACFGIDVREYPANGHGSRRNSYLQRTLRSFKVTPVRGPALAAQCYSTYCVLDPNTKEYWGPMGNIYQLIGQLDRMGIWEAAKKQGKRDLQERK